MHGWRLVLAAACTFLLPLVLALLGAMVGGKGQTGKLGAAAVGLAIGLAAAIFANKALARSKDNAGDGGGPFRPAAGKESS